MTAKKRNNKGRFTPLKEKPKQAATPPVKTRPIAVDVDTGDDIEELVVQRIDNVITVTARNESGRIVKAFTRDASLYQIGSKHDFRVARNGAYHEIAPPPPVKKVMNYDQWLAKDK